MTINKSSWHYKLNYEFSGLGKMPKSLCGYFWKTVFNILFVLFLTAIVLFFVFVILGGGFFIHDRGLEATSICLWAMIAIIGIYFLVSHIRKKRSAHSYKEPKKYIVPEYLKAFKSKICPLITYK